jgi:uncharacterized integral membrane protein (TIGR00698 family)
MIAEWKSILQELRPALPGLSLVCGVAVASRLLHGFIPAATLQKALGEVLIAIGLGLLIRNTVGVPPRCEPGIKFAIHRVLRLGIILLGLRLVLQDVVATGLTALVLVVVCIAAALTLAYLLGRLFRIPARLALLIGLGTAVCGNTAIVAAAPVVEAKDEDVGFAIATITLFGTLAVLVYPLIGHLLGMTDRVFGLWAGLAVNDTSQVVAASAAFSSAALDTATVVKLTRNTLLAPLLILVGFAYSRATRHAGRAPASAARFSWTKLVPGFVVGFLLLSVARTAGIALGWLPQNVAAPGELQSAANVLRFLDEVARFAILVALAAVSLNTSVESLRRTGPKPFVVGFCVALLLAGLSLTLILVTGAGA